MLKKSKAFSASIEIIIWLLSFNLLIWYITLIDFCILKNSCILGINPTWSWHMSFLMCCWILFAKILLRILHLCSLACSFPFLCCLCLVLISGWWWPHRMSLEMFLPLQFFESFRRISISSSLSDKILLWNHLALDFCFLGDFWSRLQFQCLWLGCS